MRQQLAGASTRSPRRPLVPFRWRRDVFAGRLLSSIRGRSGFIDGSLLFEE